MTHELLHRAATAYADRAAEANASGRFEAAKALYIKAWKLGLAAVCKDPPPAARKIYARTVARWIVTGFHHLFTDA